ncbi:Aldo/keto reductase [Amylostereum chailletii]|nr:Aldo/keto reductase [Amylostereum chailletii]
MANTPIKLNDGNVIPWLGFGTGTALYGKDASDTVVNAISAGFTHLDGAQLYLNEESLGAGIVASGKPRSELFVTTKLGTVESGQSVRETLVESLRKLKLNYVNLFLIHSPTLYPKDKLKGIWKELEGLKNEGLAKSIGVSNFRIKELEVILEDATIVPAVNQIEIHPHLLAETQPLLDFHAKHNIVTESYGGLSPLFRSEDSELAALAKSIAKRLAATASVSVTEGHVLSLWLKQKGIVAVTTTTKKERLTEYINIANVPELSVDDIAAIDTAGSKETHRHFVSLFRLLCVCYIYS